MTDHDPLCPAHPARPWAQTDCRCGLIARVAEREQAAVLAKVAALRDEQIAVIDKFAYVYYGATEPGSVDPEAEAMERAYSRVLALIEEAQHD